MAIGFMLVYSENPGKILDRICSQTDVNCLIVKEWSMIKVRRLKN